MDRRVRTKCAHRQVQRRASRPEQRNDSDWFRVYIGSDTDDVANHQCPSLLGNV